MYPLFYKHNLYFFELFSINNNIIIYILIFYIVNNNNNIHFNIVNQIVNYFLIYKG